MRRITPVVEHYQTPVRAAAPQAITLAMRLARLLGADINGSRGTIRYGYPAIAGRGKYQGYADTPQLFTGYSPQKVAAGAFRGAPGSLPSTSPPTSLLGNPLQAAMATVTAQQLAGQT